MKLEVRQDPDDDDMWRVWDTETGEAAMSSRTGKCIDGGGHPGDEGKAKAMRQMGYVLTPTDAGL